MPSYQSTFRPPSLLPSFLFLLFALLGPNNPSSSFFSPSSSALALPVSMLNWNPLANFYPLSALFRSNNLPTSSRKQPSAAMVALVVVKEPRRNEKPTALPNEQQPLLTIEEDKLPTEIAGARTAPKPSNQRKFGTLKLCPPGGRSFFEAFELACPMKKRKKRHVMFGLGGRIRAEPPRMRKYNRRDDLEEEDDGRKGRIQNDHQHREDQRRGEGEYRPANISEIMRICCVSGCEFADFFPHCGPFSMW